MISFHTVMMSSKYCYATNMLHIRACKPQPKWISRLQITGTTGHEDWQGTEEKDRRLHPPGVRLQAKG